MSVHAKTRSSNAFWLMIASAACWGLGTVMSKSALAAMPPLTVLVIQLTSSIVFLWTVVLRSFCLQLAPDKPLRELLMQVQPGALLRHGLPGLLEPGASYLLGLSGLALTTASNSTLIGSAEPVFVLGLSWVLLKQRISPLLLGLSAASIVGVLLTVGVDWQSEGQSPIGDLLIVAGTGCAALYVILAGQSVQHLPAVSLAAAQQSIGLLGVIGVWICFGGMGGFQFATIPLAVLGLVIVSGIVQYALAFWIYLQAIKTVPVSIAAQFLSLTPVFGVGGAYLFLGERLTLWQGLGMMLVIAAVAGIAKLQQET